MTHLQSAGEHWICMKRCLTNLNSSLQSLVGVMQSPSSACHIHPQPICLDLGASWHVETWVFRLDVCMIPGSDITLHDLRQDAGRKFQAL